jgi:hypothetical protein
MAQLLVGAHVARNYAGFEGIGMESNRDTSYYDLASSHGRKDLGETKQFIEAYTRALQLLAGTYVPVADPTKLKASIAKAREQALRMASTSRFPT